MKNKIKVLVPIVLVLALLTTAGIYLHHTNIAVLSPKGPIAQQERRLLYFGLILSLFVVIPVFALTLIFAVRYRETNTKAKYSPNLDRNIVAEFVWWGIPAVIIGILSVVAWNSSHTLDPYRKIASTTPTMTIQVVSLDWKWLFIYPQQGIASVNELKFPEKTPINFEITSDSVMNSFWIPQLGGQIYAMPGMSTQLNLLASGLGSYRGSSANISGIGFAGMNFMAQSTTENSFEQWARSISLENPVLDINQYDDLLKPSENNRPTTYSLADQNLYNSIISKYMPAENLMNGESMQ